MDESAKENVSHIRYVCKSYFVIKMVQILLYVSEGACTWIQLNDHLKYKSFDSQWNRHYIAMLIYSESESFGIKPNKTQNADGN